MHTRKSRGFGGYVNWCFHYPSIVKIPSKRWMFLLIRGNENKPNQYYLPLFSTVALFEENVENLIFYELGLICFVLTLHSYVNRLVYLGIYVSNPFWIIQSVMISKY